MIYRYIDYDRVLENDYDTYGPRPRDYIFYVKTDIKNKEVLLKSLQLKDFTGLPSKLAILDEIRKYNNGILLDLLDLDKDINISGGFLVEILGKFIGKDYKTKDIDIFIPKDSKLLEKILNFFSSKKYTYVVRLYGNIYELYIKGFEHIIQIIPCLNVHNKDTFMDSYFYDLTRMTLKQNTETKKYYKLDSKYSLLTYHETISNIINGYTTIHIEGSEKNSLLTTKYRIEKCMVKLESKNILVGCDNNKLKKLFKIIVDKNSDYDYNITQTNNDFYCNSWKHLLNCGGYNDDKFLEEMYDFIYINSKKGELYKSNDSEKINTFLSKATFYF